MVQYRSILQMSFHEKARRLQESLVCSRCYEYVAIKMLHGTTCFRTRKHSTYMKLSYWDQGSNNQYELEQATWEEFYVINCQVGGLDCLVGQGYIWTARVRQRWDGRQCPIIQLEGNKKYSDVLMIWIYIEHHTYWSMRLCQLSS